MNRHIEMMGYMLDLVKKEQKKTEEYKAAVKAAKEIAETDKEKLRWWWHMPTGMTEPRKAHAVEGLRLIRRLAMTMIKEIEGEK